jgi:DNA-binding XRE family transcriptional regulator
VEFAELIGVDRRTIMNYEQGKKNTYYQNEVVEVDA